MLDALPAPPTPHSLSGFSRSVSGLGIVNSTESLLRSAAQTHQRRGLRQTDPRTLQQGAQSSSLSAALIDANAVMAAIQADWSASPAAPPSGTPPFTLTLTSSAPLVLRSRQRAFSPSAGVTVGGIASSDTAVSADGRWLAFIPPATTTLCESDSMTDCSYATIVVANPAANDTRGAALACPPFCSGTVTQRAGVIPLAAAPSSAFVPATLQPSGLAEPLTVDDYAAENADGDVDGGTTLRYPAGLYFAQACSATGVYTDPASGACTNTSSPLFSLCAFGGGDACEPCPSGAMCPGGFRCWSLPGYWVAAEASPAVLPCAAPDARSRCVGWSAASAQTRCGGAYLQGSYLCGACSPRFFLDSDGSCAACPAVGSAWDRYGTVVLLIASVAGFALFVFGFFAAVIVAVGGSLKGMGAVSRPRR